MMLTLIVFIGLCTALLEIIIIHRIPALQAACTKNMMWTIALSFIMAKILCTLFHAQGITAASSAIFGFVCSQSFYSIKGYMAKNGTQVRKLLSLKEHPIQHFVARQLSGLFRSRTLKPTSGVPV